MAHITSLFCIALAGLCAGSLINMVTWRLPHMINAVETPGFSLWLPRSHCPLCRHTLAWFDNIPLLSWVMLRGHCRYCQCSIALRYPLTELLSMLLCLALAFLITPGETLLAAWLLGWMLLALLLIDAEFQLLPDLLTLPLLWLGLLFQLCGWLPQVSLEQSVTGAVSGYITLWLLARGYRVLRGTEALGMGDAKLLAALGAWLGWQPLPLVLLLASGGSILWLCFSHLVFRRSLSAPLPFGPGLAIAGLLMFTAANLSATFRTSSFIFQI